MISDLSGLAVLAMAQSLAPPAAPPVVPSPPVKARALITLADLIRSDDYPDEARRHEEEGTVGFRVEIGADGRVAACSVTASSGSAALDATTCRLVKARARFMPARDSLGRPVTDQAASRVVWRLRDNLALDFAPTMYISVIKSTPAGEATCWSESDRQPPEYHPCNSAVAARIGDMARAAGRTVEQTVVTRFTPAGEAPLDPGERGDPIMAADAELSVGNKGVIRTCRVTRNEYIGANAGLGAPPSACDDYPPGSTLLKPAGGRGPPRSVTVEIHAYRRTL